MRNEMPVVENVLQETADLLPEFRIGLVAAEAAMLSTPASGVHSISLYRRPSARRCFFS